MTIESTQEQVSLGEVVASLSHALDLTEGQPLGHAMRTCVIGMRIAGELQLSSTEKSSLYYALLMKDAGCSANASRFAAVFGTDDRQAKPRMKVADWHRKLGLASKTFAVAGTGRGMLARIRHFAAIARTEDFTREIIQTRCERGSAIARRIGFPDDTADAIRSLDEHWCGLGYPDGKVGDEIPLFSRIANVAQTIDAFFMERGPEAALRVVRERRGAWFDPRLCDVVKSWTPTMPMWRELRSPDLDAVVVGLEPEGRHLTVDGDGLDEVSRAFADIIDAKSPFTWHHSVRVADLARDAMGHLGADPLEQRRLYRAGLLHDIGKLGVSNTILDKPGKLSPAERMEIERHPMHSLAILMRVSAFGDLAWTASVHHEALDGSGYPWKLTAKQLDPAARTLAVADVYDALTADRPYRAAMSREDALRIIDAQRGTRLDPDAVDAIAEVTRQPPVMQGTGDGSR